MKRRLIAAFNSLNILRFETVEIIDQSVNLAAHGTNLAVKRLLVVRSSRGGSLPVQIHDLIRKTDKLVMPSLLARVCEVNPTDRKAFNEMP